MSNQIRLTPIDLVDRVALHRDSVHPALVIADGTSVTFEELLASATERAIGLESDGVLPGAVVAVSGQPGIATAVDILACWSLGAAVTVLDPAIGSWEVNRRLEAARATFRIVDPANSAERTDSAPPGDGSLEATLVVSTSGTTGSPKAIALSAGNIIAAVDQLADRLATGPGDVLLAALPLFHAAGFVMQFAGGLLGGWTQVIIPRFSADSAWQLISAHHVTHTHLVPRMLELLSDTAPAELPTSLRFVSCGAAALPPASARRFTDATGVRVLRGYGLSETGAVAHHVSPDDDGSGDDRQVGPAVLHSQTKIVNPDGADVTRGEIGAVLLRGPQVATGYVGGAPFPDGWLPTGDLGSLDEQGRLVIAARDKDVIRYNAHQVFPAELEELLLTHPAVQDVVVVGRPDQSAGEIPVARVVRLGTIDEAELIEYVAARVAPYRRVRAIEFVETIERGPLGKPRALPTA